MPKIISIIIWKSIIAVFAVFVVSCNKKPSDPNDYKTYHFPPEVRELFNDTLGEVRIYRDSASGIYDTATCDYARHRFIKSTFGEMVLFEEESFAYHYFHSHYRTGFYYLSRLAVHDDGRQYFYISESGQAYLLRFPLVIGDSISDGHSSSHSVLKAFYPSVVIGNKVFENVYFFKRNKMTARMGSDADYYLAKNRGIVAIREYKTNKLWILQ